MPAKIKREIPPAPPSEALKQFAASVPPELIPPDPGTPRGRILEAARRVFADRGFDGTSTRALADAAEVNLAMIHYYYGSKEQLYERVLAGEIVGMYQAVLREVPDESAPEEALLSLPIRLMTVLRADPLRAALFRREIAAGAPYIILAIQNLGEFGPIRLAGIFQTLYENAVRSKKLRDLPPDSVRETLLALAFSSLYMGPVLSVVAGRNFDDEAVWTEWTKTLNVLLRQGLLVESKV
jgi:AcrR family transcriptional regulator